MMSILIINSLNISSYYIIMIYIDYIFYRSDAKRFNGLQLWTFIFYKSDIGLQKSIK